MTGTTCFGLWWDFMALIYYLQNWIKEGLKEKSWGSGLWGDKFYDFNYLPTKLRLWKEVRRFSYGIHRESN